MFHIVIQLYNISVRHCGYMSLHIGYSTVSFTKNKSAGKKYQKEVFDLIFHAPNQIKL